MDAARFDQIAHEVIQLLDEQMEALVDQKSRRFTSKEKTGYDERKRKILALRSELSRMSAEKAD